MTRVTSLKVGDSGYHHRVHRSKKGRKNLWGKDGKKSLYWKKAKLEELKIEELEDKTL